jgi:hypothetical protein
MLSRRARLQSRTPLRRRARLRQRSANVGQFAKMRKPLPRRRETPRRRPAEYIDRGFLEFLRHRPCRVTWWHEHASIIDPHHARHDENGASVGANLKNDKRACSLCRICHGCIDPLSGPFRGWTRARVREWMDAQIAEQRAEFLARLDSQR